MLFVLVSTLLAAFLMLLLVRYIAFKLAIDRYIAFCISYAHAAKRSQYFLKEVTQVWPMSRIMGELTYWRMDRYIINQDAYKEMMDDLEKRALDILAKLEERVKAALEAEGVTIESGQNPQGTQSPPPVPPVIESVTVTDEQLDAQRRGESEVRNEKDR